MTIEENKSLKPFNTFGIEVKTRAMATIRSHNDLIVLFEKKLLQQPLLVLGGGSNVLLTRDFEGLTLCIDLKGLEIQDAGIQNKKILKAGAGENWHQLVLFAIKNNLGGIENLSLIPGKAGAAPMQNIGAYGVELKDVFYELEAFEISTGKLKKFSNENCRFGYRESVFKRDLAGQFIITSISLILDEKPNFNTSYGAIEEELAKTGKQKSLENISEAIIQIRKSKLPNPDEIGNAGSFFKNPTIPKSHYLSLKTKFPEIPSYPIADDWVKVPAGWLIEKCGLKGFKKGNCGVHDKQALVLINLGKASGKEIYDLSESIIQTVHDTFHILLEREVNIL
jgi:UDP-N-acetylmuramate dehydrogenase